MNKQLLALALVVTGAILWFWADEDEVKNDSKHEGNSHDFNRVDSGGNRVQSSGVAAHGTPDGLKPAPIEPGFPPPPVTPEVVTKKDSPLTA